MAYNYILGNHKIAQIDSELLKNYREVMSISEDKKNARVLRDIIYTNILEDEYYTDEVEKQIQTLQRYAKYHKFNNVSELIEYFMHRAIDEKLDTCGNCNKYFHGICAIECEEVRVAKYRYGCRSNPYIERITQEEFMERLKQNRERRKKNAEI